MIKNKVVVRALQQFVYLDDNYHYEFIDVNEEVEIDIERAARWSSLNNVDVLNPYLNENMDKYKPAFDEYKKVGDVLWP